MHITSVFFFLSSLTYSFTQKYKQPEIFWYFPFLFAILRAWKSFVTDLDIYVHPHSIWLSVDVLYSIILYYIIQLYKKNQVVFCVWWMLWLVMRFFLPRYSLLHVFFLHLLHWTCSSVFVYFEIFVDVSSALMPLPLTTSITSSPAPHKACMYL